MADATRPDPTADSLVDLAENLAQMVRLLRAMQAMIAAADPDGEHVPSAPSWGDFVERVHDQVLFGLRGIRAIIGIYVVAGDEALARSAAASAAAEVLARAHSTRLDPAAENVDSVEQRRRHGAG